MAAEAQPHRHNDLKYRRYKTVCRSKLAINCNGMSFVDLDI